MLVASLTQLVCVLSWEKIKKSWQENPFKDLFLKHHTKFINVTRTNVERQTEREREREAGGQKCEHLLFF